MPITYPTPRRARYTPVKGKLAYPVRVLGERDVYGRHEYAIQAPDGHLTVWVTAGEEGQQLQFEEDQL